MILKIFDVNDVIIIINKMIEDLKNEDIYGIEVDTLEIPQYINEKIDMLDENSCEELFSIMDEIAQNVYELKSGELHELNLMNKEIMILVERKLNKYIK